MDNGFTSSHASTQASFLSRLTASLQKQWQLKLDLSVPYTKTRWAFFFVFLSLYYLRVHFLQGFYIVTYGLGIYLLNQFIGFIAPKEDPESEGPLLPSYDHDEYKPFVRRLPEFKCWYSATRAVFIAFLLTLSSFFDFPVFWPILVVYFLILLFLTMKKQIKHMIKHKYIPFSFGKPKFSGVSSAQSSNGGAAVNSGLNMTRPTASLRSKKPGVGQSALKQSVGVGASNGPAGAFNRHTPQAGFSGNVPLSSIRSTKLNSAKLKQ